MKNVVLFFGGKSCEHDISIITAMQVQAHLSSNKFNVVPIYITKTNKWFNVKGLTEPKQFANFEDKKYKQLCLIAGTNILYQKNKKKLKAIFEVDCAIIACHGMNGEDGTLQGLLELSDIPYTSSDVLSSSVNMDKVVMKQIFEVNNLPITKFVEFSSKEYLYKKASTLQKIKQNLDFPLIVKPANLGSSIGISKCKNAKDLEKAINISLKFDSKIIVEEVVLNLKEYNCAVCGFQDDIIVSSVEEVTSWQEFLDFKEKYIAGNKVKKQRTVIAKNIVTEIKNMSRFAFKKLGCCGVVRIDYLFNADTEELFINEINTIPGSFANYMFKNLTFAELLEKLIYYAEEKHNEKNKHTFSYESCVLESGGIKSK